MSAESPLEKALNRLLWKMPKPPGCDTAEDVARWMMAEMADIGIRLDWRCVAQELKIQEHPPGPDAITLGKNWHNLKSP